MSSTKTGSYLIYDERIRQIVDEGYNSYHDSMHSYSELVMAAIAYLYSSISDGEMAKKSWCWGSEYFKPSGTKRDLIKAGALIAAAIDRLDSEGNRSINVLFDSGTPTKSGHYLTVRRSRIDGSEYVAHNHYSTTKTEWEIDPLDGCDIVAWKLMNDIDVEHE